MRKKKQMALIAGSAIGALALASLSTSAAAVVTGPAGPPTTSQSDAGAELRAEIARIATIAEENYPDEFAYANIDEESMLGHLSFKGTVPQEILNEARGVTQISFASNMGFSVAELQSYAAQLSQSVETSTTDSFSVLVSPRPTDSEFIVGIGPAAFEAAESEPSADLSNDADQIVEDIQDFVQENPPPASFAVQIDTDLESTSRPEAEDGGRNFEGCTGAFPVKRVAGPELGILTAGHCDGVGRYGSTSNMFYPVYPFSQSTTTGANTGGDLRWNHSRYMLSGSTYLGSGGKRKFASASNAVFGTQVCGYGRTTGHKCGPVFAVGSHATIYIKETKSYYTVGPLTCLVNHVTKGGDSGGPWYLKNTSVATGIHSGFYNGSSCWSSARNALRAFNLNLWTG